MNKKAELKRLHSIVFEGAPGWAKWAAMDEDENWYWYRDKPRIHLAGLCWIHTSVATPDNKVCDLIRDFHKTELPWQETLISRGE